MNITDILDQLGITYARGGEHHHVRFGWVGINCSQCSPESMSFKLGISEVSYACSCWTCGKSNLAWSLHLASGRPYAQVKELLGGLARELPSDYRPPGKLVLPPGLMPLLPAHRKYLQGRGIDPDEAAAVWGLKGLGIAGKLSWRVFIPVDHRGKTVSWTTRSTGSKGLRYVSASPEQESLSHKQVLFGAGLAGHAVMVVEGPLDAVRVGPGAVSTLGVKYTPSQVAAIARFPLRLICMDNEPPAQRAARRLCRELSCHPGTTRLVKTNAKDPGSASEREVKELRRMLK